MSLHKIKKQKLLYEPFTGKTLKFARAIFNTHIEDDKNLFMEIKISNIIKFLNLHPGKDAINDIVNILEELNEPLCVREFKYFGKVYPIRFVTFCTYTLKEETIEIDLSEEFLHVEDEYMLDSFLKH